MLKTFGDHAERERLHPSDSFISVLAIGHDARQGRHFREPASVIFSLDFNGERHGGNVPSGQTVYQGDGPDAASGRSRVPPGAGHRRTFAWNFHYAATDGVFRRTDITLLDLQSNPLGLDRSDPAAKDDITTVNQLYLPVNKPIIVRLRSKDVIHSFGVPEFRVKQDAVPGLTIPIWFIPNVTTAEMRTRTGNPEFQYEIACAQLCGLGHYRMRGFVTVQTAEEFQKWMEDTVQEQSEPDPFR